MTTQSTTSLELFRSACGASGPLAMTVTGPEPGTVATRSVAQPFLLVGRDPRADLQLDHTLVSRRHAYLQFIDGQWFGVDLLSQRGTHWPEGPRGAGWLDAGHGIQLGPFVLRPAGEEEEGVPAWDPLNDRVPDSPALPGVHLEFLNGEVRQSAWRMSRVLALVGQSPDCKVRLVAPGVSKYHCALLRTAVGVWAVDLFGRQGTRVNRQERRFALLREGDLLEVGQFIVRIRYDSPPRVPASDRVASEPAHRGDAPRNGTDARAGTEPVVTTNPLVVSESQPMVFLPTERGTGETEVVERLLVPLVNEFRLMQQQMFDQFQQAMTSMFDMFTGMHREQADLIREELDRLHELTQELHNLQGELAKYAPRPGMQAIGTSAPEPDGRASREHLAASAPTNGEPGDEIHAWLTQRMATIQRERQSSWQRLLNFLTGRRG